MKKIGSLLVILVAGIALTFTGCGNAQVKEKGPITGKEETSPEMQAEIEKTMKNAQKQFGDRASEAPTKEDDE